MFIQVGQDTPQPFSISVQSGAGAALSGALDRNTVDLFTVVVEALKYPTVTVDVVRLIGIDEDGIAAIERQDAKRRAHRGRILLVGAPTWLQERLIASGLDHLLPRAQQPI